MVPFDEQLVRLIADARNRAILTILHEVARPLSTAELVNHLSEHDELAGDVSDENDDREALYIALHHNHLPKLDEAGLIDYDPAENVVTAENVPDVDADWQDLEKLEELGSCMRAGSDIEEDAIGVLESREDVIEYGRYLADEADEELFCMYTTTDLLEEEHLEHAEAALERGVEISLGSKNPKVRDLARDRLPEATIWEPQLDWMNAPSGYPKIGRLVLADREQIMLALLKNPDTDSHHPEIAVIGEGRDNPLVVLVRDLLGPRLDHLDYQSDEFLAELPFEP